MRTAYHFFFHCNRCKQVSVVILVNLALAFVGFTSLSAHQGFSGEFYNSLSLDITNKAPLSSFDSSITFSYETDHLALESETDFELDGYSQHQLEARFEHNPGDLKAEVTFEPDTGLPTDFNLQEAIELEDKAETELLIELDADHRRRTYTGSSYELEWDFDLERHITGDLTAEIGLTFQKEDITFPLPTETEFQLTNLKNSHLGLDTSIEFEKAELDVINLDFEFIEPIFYNPTTRFSTDTEWEPSQDFIKCEPEIDFDYFTLSAEYQISLEDNFPLSSVYLQELNLDGVEIIGIETDFSLDLESREIEIGLSTTNNRLQLELEISSNHTNSRNSLQLEEFDGELEWETEDFGEFTLEFESDGKTFPDEITVSSKHDF